MVRETGCLQSPERNGIRRKKTFRRRGKKKENGGRDGEGQNPKRTWACPKLVPSKSSHFLWNWI